MIMANILKNTTHTLLLLTLTLLPSFVSASNIYIDTNHSEFYVGDTIVFNVRVDSQNKNINTIEGNILLEYSPESVSIQNLNLSESALSLWPQKPTPSEDSKIVSFSGGTPKGFNSTNALVFKVVLNFKKAGEITLTPSGVSVYLNDGKGTKDTVTTKDLVIPVLPKKSDSHSIDDWNKNISKDTTPPERFEIFIGQDTSVFEGKKFLSFNTTDTDSGIGYYEVIEGNLPPVRGEKTYVLKEQETPTKVIIIAYDIAGNMRKSEYNPTTPNIFYPIVIIFLVLVMLAEYIVDTLKRKKENVFVRK